MADLMADITTKALEIGSKTAELKNLVLSKTQSVLGAEENSQINQAFGELNALMQGLVGAFMSQTTPDTEKDKETEGGEPKSI